MSESFEQLKKRYADAIWLRSETTLIRGPLRDGFDPPLHSWDVPRRMGLMPEPQRFEVTVTTASGVRRSVITFGEVDVALFDTGERLVIFRAIFGEHLADFAVVTDRLTAAEHENKMPLELPTHRKSIPRGT